MAGRHGEADRDRRPSRVLWRALPQANRPRKNRRFFKKSGFSEK